MRYESPETKMAAVCCSAWFGGVLVKLFRAGIILPPSPDLERAGYSFFRMKADWRFTAFPPLSKWDTVPFTITF